MEKYIYEQNHMGTRVNITLFSPKAEKEFIENIQNAFHIFEKLENQFSIFRENSEITQINKRAGQKVQVTQLMFETITAALKIAEATDGSFNPLVGSYTIPNALLNPSVSNNNFRQIQINPVELSVTLPPNSSLDLNSMVKGLAIDLALDCLQDEENIMIEAGGDIKVKGLPPNQNYWKIGIRDPQNPTKLITLAPLRNSAICTSGEYFRKPKALSENRLHLVNPLSPHIENQTSSLTVIAPESQTADALSTAAFFMSIDQAINFVESYDNCSCLIIDNQNNIYMSPRMKSLFSFI